MKARRLSLEGLVILVALSAALVGGWPGDWRTEAGTGSGAMAVDCDGARAGIQSQCTHSIGYPFSVHVHVTEPPAGGYFSFSTTVRWTDGVLKYAPTAATGDEALWPDCTIPGRFDNTPGDPSMLFGCAPFPSLGQGSTFTGPVLTFAFSCKAPSGPTSILDLVPQAGDTDKGTHFLDASGYPVAPALSNARVTCIAAVGGIAELPDVDAAPLGEPGSSGKGRGLLVGITAAITAAAVALGGAAWYARRRRG